ncbi:hypothetical protein PR003_g21320 [Phytophthora rubi]|uniref:Uncharacterized protein n=1 Tax=Phytophthora rubi TaxID=129364 RepID=A0A6A4DCR9_9STRA|nr:hypothetical protein PR003_g21320 [Phytophthora rubi]
MQTPTPAPDTPKTPPAPTSDKPAQPPALMSSPQSGHTLDSKRTASHGVLAHGTEAPEAKPVSMPEPTTLPVQKSKKTPTPTQNPSHTSAKRASGKRKARPSENKIGNKGKESSSGSSAGTRVPKPKEPKRVVSPHELIGANDSASEKSSTSGDREKVAAAHVNVINHADAVPRKGYRSWQQLMEALKAYGIAKGFHFRIRSSKSVVKCRGSDGPEIPADFTFGFRNFRCIHGVMQASRGDGVRDSHVNFTDCKARFDACVSRVKTADGGQVWCVIVKNEWRLHNHHSEQGRRVRGINDLPSEGPVADSIAILADAGAGSQQIASYATAELGQRVSSQVIRNVLRRMQTNSSAQERLKTLLHDFKQVKGSEVLVIQDDLDITCGIVIQSQVQKLVFTQ